MKAKKKYGQHFLTDHNAAQNIANLVDNYQTVPNLLEIGPGKGFLTQYLLEKNKRYKAVEIDEEAAAYLLKNGVLDENQLIQGDFLHLNLHEIFDGEPFLLIGNFPYNISSQIVFTMIDHLELIPAMMGMFQLEMADRIISPKDQKSYGVISVLTQLYYQGEIIMKLGPEQFSPPPKIDSAVITLERIKENQIVEHKKVRSLVKQSFLNRRKMLRNTLKPYMTPENQEEHYWTLRPENLSPEDFVHLAKTLVDPKSRP